MHSKHTLDPRAFLPLSPIAFQVLLSLSDGPRHGYGVIQEIDARTNGLMRLRTGTLYLLMQRLVADGLAESVRPPKQHAAASTPGSPRRYYEMTALGRSVLAAETRRLQAAVADARAKRVLSKA